MRIGINPTGYLECNDLSYLQMLDLIDEALERQRCHILEFYEYAAEVIDDVRFRVVLYGRPADVVKLETFAHTLDDVKVEEVASEKPVVDVTLKV